MVVKMRVRMRVKSEDEIKDEEESHATNPPRNIRLREPDSHLRLRSLPPDFLAGLALVCRSSMINPRSLLGGNKSTRPKQTALLQIGALDDTLSALGLTPLPSWLIYHYICSA